MKHRELPHLRLSSGDAVNEGLRQERRFRYIDGWKRSIGPVTRRRSRCSHELTVATSAVGLSRMMQREKARREGLVS